MCHYCGCRQMPLIRDYIAEHERVTDLADEAVRALDGGDFETAGSYLGAMSAELETHWRGEENGIFRAMQREEQYADYIAPLVQEHRELAHLLATVDVRDPADQHRLRTAVFELYEHISKEEDGLFPASLTELSGEEWDAAMRAWYEAHPGSNLIQD